MNPLRTLEKECIRRMDLYVATLIYSFVQQRCSCHDVAPDETCADCLKGKANIGRLVLLYTITVYSG